MGGVREGQQATLGVACIRMARFRPSASQGIADVEIRRSSSPLANHYFMCDPHASRLQHGNATRLAPLPQPSIQQHVL